MTKQHTSEVQELKVTYFTLLKDMQVILKQFNTWNHPDNHICKLEDQSKVQTALTRLEKYIEPILDKMSVSKQSIFTATLLNTLIRIHAASMVEGILPSSQVSKLWNSLSEHTFDLLESNNIDYECCSDMLQSMLMNLGNYNFIENCFNHLLQTDSKSRTDSTTTYTESVDKAHDHFIGIIADYIDLCTELAQKPVVRSAFEFEKNHRDVMTSLLKLANSYMKAEDEAVHENNEKLIYAALGFLINLTDKISLIPMFINIDCHKAVIEWIEGNSFEHQSQYVCYRIINIVYNLARSKKGLEALRREKAFKALIKRQNWINEQKRSTLQQIFAAAVVLITSNSEKEKPDQQLIMDASNYWYDAAEKASSSPSLQSDSGYHLSELLELLHHAVFSSTLAKRILKENSKVNRDMVSCFAMLLPKIYGALFDPEADELEQSAVDSLLKIILHMCCYEECRKILYPEIEFCTIVEALASSPKQNVAKCISRNLQLEKLRVEKGTKQPHMVYISFHWDNNDFCNEFSSRLKTKLGALIWVDNENFNVWEEMSEYVSSAVHVSNVIIVLASKSYIDETGRFPEITEQIFGTDPDSTSSEYKSGCKITVENEKRIFIVITAESGYTFPRQRYPKMRESDILPYDKSIDRIVTNVCKKIEPSENSVTTCLPSMATTQSRVCALM